MTEEKQIHTSLGPVLVPVEDGLWEIDLTHLRIFFGLSILSRTIGEEIGNQLHSLPGDLSFTYKINPNINHELVDMHIQHVQVFARAGILKDWVLFREEFEENLRFVFGSFQQQSVAKKIHPEFYGEDPNRNASVALLFPFETEFIHDSGYYILMERVASQYRIGDFFLRITIDTQEDGCLNLKNIKHEIISDAHTRTYIAGASKISESLSTGIINAAQKGETFYEEENSHFSKVFSQIEKTPLGKLTNINFYWEEQYRNLILSSDPSVPLSILKKLFLLLEDSSASKKIKEGNTIRAVVGKVSVYVDLSRLDRVLNFSINGKRTLLDSTFYLKRMPLLEEIANGKGHTYNFDGVHVFLIHHITSEIISLIETFRRLKVSSLDVAFVKYGGNIPPVYLDILLDIPTETFFMAGLEFKLTKNNTPYYGVSPLYSAFDHHSTFRHKLEDAKLGFFDAMRRLAIFLFLNKLLSIISKNGKMLLIEDGGYVAPILNERALDGVSFGSVLDEFWVESKDNTFRNKPFGEILKSYVIGTVEHTRNGYDRLVKVKEDKKELFLPAFSIAISKEKTQEESKEVARSILNALDNTLHGIGKVLSKRKLLLLGSKGNIGGFLKKYLIGGFLHENNLDILEVDKKFDSESRYVKSDFNHISDLEFAEIDLIIGVTGESIISPKTWESWILNSKHKQLFLASGSTKTVEFADFIKWINELNLSQNPKLGGLDLKISFHRILDPQTQMDLGSRILFQIPKKEIEKEVFLISDGSPVNFLFFGVPTESMDPIISQLASVSLGMVNDYKSNELPSADLYAVDHQINVWGKFL
ncbi:hypothetical protein EHQ16_07360 [Leptospira kanakyensis]|uniref:Uncharacterized protein n=1 Tax=Leptospira kanakyensis TaxID=2484968 RepID=A0A6N4QDN3_9LEPT|nr:hypothetical protein [Leptospira kanakyensis]TGK50169.1 hypothetical protein EHQ11_10655 [Leptospira kanakyensis]TGK64230.1 hypothetical protein EHQ16_07360 [Leptospira kanakyensis]TGK69307.1 hypothetical protein EHQ18_10815 [Leptospira kanakyensis]